MTCPSAPARTISGNYEPVALADFLITCKDLNTPHHEIAKTLQISRDRVTYAMGDGYDAFVRHAMMIGGSL